MATGGDGGADGVEGVDPSARERARFASFGAAPAGCISDASQDTDGPQAAHAVSRVVADTLVIVFELLSS